MAVKQNIMSEQGVSIPFPYINNFSFNDPAWTNPHPVSISLRIYNMIGNKLRRIYLVPSSLDLWADNLQAGACLVNSASTVQLFIDSNLITQYDNTRYEYLLNCKLSNKYWSNGLHVSNFFLPVYFYDWQTDSNNLNEGLPVTSDTIIWFLCNNTGTDDIASYDVFAEGIKY
jgi:hypothetical protein